MSTVLREITPFLTNPFIVVGLFVLAFFSIARSVIPKETLQAWRQRPSSWLVGLVTSNYLFPILGFILVSVGAIQTSGPKPYIYSGHQRTPYVGNLKIADGQAFLLPDANQGLPDSILMMMRDIPPGGTPNERINSAPSYFTLTLQKVNGDRIAVIGSAAPFGGVQVLVVEQ